MFLVKEGGSATITFRDMNGITTFFVVKKILVVTVSFLIVFLLAIGIAVR
jgi:hypothetical protein